MSQISNEYAQALFSLALEKKSALEYKNALEFVKGVFDKNPTYIDFLSTFAITLDERLQALDKAFCDAVPKDVLSFLKILCQKKHITQFYECVEKYNAMYNEMDKVLEAKVTSAVELNDEQKNSLKLKLEKSSGRKVTIEYKLDESVIGGMIVEYDGKIIDSSLKKHLKDIKDVINR